MSKLVNGFFLFISLITFVRAETHITGDITGMTFESGGNPYIVEQDILIPAGSKAVIKEGCVFLFKPFTGLTVHGHLLVEGSVEQPVIFSSVNDGDYNQASEQLPNPFDWNGILISRESGTVTFKNFGLRYSVYGIKSQNQNIVIENGLFRQNGQFHFTINDKIQFVQDNIPYSYNGLQVTVDKPNPPPPPGGGTTSQPNNSSLTRNVIRYSSLAVGIGCTIGSIYSGIEMFKSYQDMKYAKIDSVNKYSSYKKRYFQMRNTCIVTGIIAGLGYTGFGLTFVY